MTDYWKSYSKKFCEICKVWYADNKISSERHETGAKHKVMVQQKLRESAKKAKDKELKDHDLRMTILSMEQAAKSSMSSKSQKSVPSMPEEFNEESKRPEELIRIEPKPELIESTQIDVTSTGGHPYGPWVPVKKEIPKPDPPKEPEKPKKRYDDLPEQHYGPGTSTIIPEELLEVALIDPEELKQET
uniref:Matrin-type domain-containing protein n=1 Tax=Meloidogyne javanica TaxID=6303 RepID=A0A915M282_MELJA